MLMIRKIDNQKPPQAQRLKSHRKKVEKTIKPKFSWKKFFLKILKFLLLIFVFLALIFGVKLIREYQFPTVDKVDVKLNSQYLDSREIKDIIAKALSQQDNFFSFKTSALQQKLKTIPWIGYVVIKRQWPNMLSIDIKEQKPVAKWNNIALVNDQMELFMPEQMDAVDNLPLLYGPEEEASEVVNAYFLMQKMLDSYGFTIKSLGINNDDSWHMILKDNIDVFLGTDNIVAHVKNFVKAYPKIKSDNPNKEIVSIDLRYQSGVAIHWS